MESNENVKSLVGVNVFVEVIIRTNTTVLIDQENQKETLYFMALNSCLATVPLMFL
jgi:hypothetical protein